MFNFGNLQLASDTDVKEVSANEMKFIVGGSSVFKVFSNPTDPGLFLVDINGALYFADQRRRSFEKANDFYQNCLQPVVASGGNQQWTEIV